MTEWIPRRDRIWNKIKIAEDELRRAVTTQPPPPPPEEEIPAWIQAQIGQYQRLGQGTDLGKAFGVLTAGQILATGEEKQRLPTIEERARGIYAYQPTYATEKAYEEWKPPGITLPGTKNPTLNILSGLILAQPTETGETRLDIKSAIELIPYLMLPLGKGTRATALTNLNKQVLRIEAKLARNETISLAERNTLKQATTVESQLSRAIKQGKLPPQIADLINKETLRMGKVGEAGGLPKEPIKPKVTPVTGAVTVEFMSGTPRRVQTQITKLIDNLPADAKLDVKRIKITPREDAETWGHYLEKTKTIEFYTHELTDEQIYHELAHSIFTTRIGKGDFRLLADLLKVNVDEAKRLFKVGGIEAQSKIGFAEENFTIDFATYMTNPAKLDITPANILEKWFSKLAISKVIPVTPEVTTKYNKAITMLNEGSTIDEVVKANVLTVSEAEKLLPSYQRIRANRLILKLDTEEAIRKAIIEDITPTIPKAPPITPEVTARKPLWAGKTDIGGEPPKPPEQPTIEGAAQFPSGRRPGGIEKQKPTILQDPYAQLVKSVTEERIPIKDRITNFKDKIMREFYDRNRPLKELENETGVPAHKLAQVVPGSTAAGENVLRKFYRPILNTVQKDIKFLEQYMVGMRNQDIVARNPEARLPGGLTGGGNVKALEILEKRLGTKFNSIRQASEQLWKLNDEQVLMKLRDEGLISKELYTEIKSANPHYIPFQRADFISNLEKNFAFPEADVVSTNLKRLSLEGSERTLDNPLARLEAGVIRTQQIIFRNRAAKAIVDALRQLEKTTGEKLVNIVESPTTRRMQRVTGEQISTVSKAERSNLLDTIRYFENGERITAEVPSIYARVARGMEWEANNVLTSVFQKMSAPLRHGAVTYNPAFVPVNIIRDALTAFFREKLIPLSPEYVRGWTAVIRKNALFDEAAMNGVYLSGIVDTMRPTQALSRVHMLGAITVRSPKDALLVLPRLVERVNITAEQATRTATFRKLRAQGIDALEAAVRSRDVTVDFAKAGTTMRVINQIIPFSNAAVQGSANLLRVFKHNPKWALAASAIITIPTILSRVNNMRWDSSNLIPDYEYTNNWIVQIGEFIKADGTLAPIYIKIPKGQIGAMLTFLPEALFNYNRRDNDKSVVENILEAGRQALKSASPISTDVAGWMPPLLGTAVGVGTNVDPFTGREIVPYWEKKKTPTTEQFSAETSQFAIATGQRFNLSPKLVEYAIKDYTGGTGQLSLWLLDLGLGALGYNPQEEKGVIPATATEKISTSPVSSRFVGTRGTRPFYLKNGESGGFVPSNYLNKSRGGFVPSNYLK